MSVTMEMDAERGDRDFGERPIPRKGVYMEQALSETKFGRFNYLLILLSGMVLNAILMETCGISFVMPVFQCDLSLTTQEKGILGAVSFLGIITSSHMWGFLADTKGRRRVMQPTLLIASALTLCSSFTTDFLVLAALRFLNGVFIAASCGTIYAYLGEFHDSKNSGRAIMASATIYGVSCLFLPLIAYCVINNDWEFYVPVVNVMYKPWRLLLVICGLPGLLSGVVMFFLPESPKFLLGQGDQNGAIEIIKKVHRWNNPNAPALELYAIHEEAESIENRRRVQANEASRFPLLTSIWLQTAPLFKAPYLGSTLLICLLQFLIYSTSNGFYMFFIDILNRMAHNLDDLHEQRVPMCTAINMNRVNTSQLILDESPQECITKLELGTLEQGIILELLYAGGFGLISLIINRVGKFPILFVVLVGSGAGGFACMLTDVPIYQIYSFIALMCCGIAANILSASTIEIYPTALRAMSVCISLMFGRLGGVVGSFVGASLLDDHCETAFYLSASTIVACGFGAFFVKNIHQKSPKTSIKMEPRLSTLSHRI